MGKNKGFLGRLFGYKKNEGGGCCNTEIVANLDCESEGKHCGVNDMANTDIAESADSNGKMIIKVVGTGCSKCNRLYENVEQAVQGLGIECEILKVTEMMEIAATGIMQTPGLIINNKIVSSGKVPGVDELMEIIRK